MQIEAVRALAGVRRVAVVQNKHVEMLVDRRLSELVYERVPLLRQIREVKPDWRRRYNIDTGDLHHGGHDVQVIVPARYDAHDAYAWYVTWFPSVPWV